MKTASKSTTASLRKVLIRRYHTLCSRLGMDRDDRTAMLAAYEVESSTQLSARQLEDICDKLDKQLHPDLAQLDTWRKRVMASVGGWLRLIGREQNAQVIKAIACRATQHENYNDIPVDRLRNLYYSFLNKQKDLKRVGEITAEELEILSYLN